MQEIFTNYLKVEDLVTLWVRVSCSKSIGKSDTGSAYSTILVGVNPAGGGGLGLLAPAPKSATGMFHCIQ